MAQGEGRRKGYCSSEDPHGGNGLAMLTKVLPMEKLNTCQQRVGLKKYPIPSEYVLRMRGAKSQTGQEEIFVYVILCAYHKSHLYIDHSMY